MIEPTPLTIKKIRDFILDSKITNDQTILLHPDDYNDIVLEYLEEYYETIPIPYILIGVLIQEDYNVFKSKIKVVKKDLQIKGNYGYR